MDIPVRSSQGPSFRSGTQGDYLQRRNAETNAPQPMPSQKENHESAKWTDKIFDIMISVSLAAIFFGVPLFFTGFTSQGISFEKQMYFYFWILIALIAWTSNGVIRGEMKIRRTPIDVPIIIFWLIYLLATIFSVDRWHSFWGFFGDPTHGFVNITACIIVFYLILSHFGLRRLKIMLGSLLASGLLIILWEILVINGALKGLDQNFVSAHPWVQYLPISPLGSISGAAVFLGVLIIIAVTAFLKTQSSSLEKIKKILLLAVLSAIILVSLYILLAFFNFMPKEGILVGVVFFLVYIMARIINPGKGSTWLPMSVFMGVLAILLIGSYVSSNASLLSVQLPAEVSPQHQLSWQIAKESIKDKFFLGSGPATYSHAFALYRPQEFNMNNLYTLNFYQASGVLWETLSTVGALGTFAFLLLVVSFLGVTIYFVSKDKGKNKIYSLGTLSAALVIIASSFFIRLDGSIVILGVLLSALAMGAILAEGETKEENLNLSLKASPKYALALAFVFLVVSAGVVFLFVFLGRVYAADVMAGIAGRQSNLTEENSINKVGKAINLYNKEGRYYTLGGQMFIALANNEFLKGKDADAKKIGNYLEKSIALTSNGKNLMPKDIVAASAVAQAYENRSTYLGQFFDEAIEAYKEALALSPHSPDIYLKIGQLKAKQASVEKDEAKKKTLLSEATDMFQKSVDEKKNFASGYYYLSLMQDQNGDLDKALESAKNAYVLNRQDINILFNLGSLLQKKGGDENITDAEASYLQILKVAPNDINTHLNLGLLYENQKKKDLAIEQYQKVLDVLPAESAKAKEQIQKFINNVRNGISNEAKAEVQAPEVPSAETPSITAPENVNPQPASPAPAENPAPVPAAPAPVPAPTPAPTP